MFERITALFRSRPQPPPVPSVTAGKTCVESGTAINATRIGNDGSISATGDYAHFRRCLASVPSLAPRDASVRAFLVWMQEIGEASIDWEQSELFEQYDLICEFCDVTVANRMPAKWFWRALEGHGCQRWQADYDDGPRRRRPYIVRIPRVLADIDTAPSGNITPISARQSTKSARSGTRPERVRRIASKVTGGGKGGRYSAGVSNAVAI